MMANWTFLTSHARVLLCIAHDPGVRLHDIAASLGITERSAYGIVTDLANGSPTRRCACAAARSTVHKLVTYPPQEYPQLPLLVGAPGDWGSGVG
jgi:hypothetical protein